MLGLYIGIGIVLIIVIYIFVVYNGLVQSRNRVTEAFSTMDVYLKKRWDLIPNIVEVVKGYAKHEKTTLEEVTKLRSGNYDTFNDNEKIEVSKKIQPALNKIMALTEAYPELKADKQFQDLSDNLRKAEDDIANARKYYNATVRIMNDKIQMFPSNIIAKLFGFKTYEMFEAKASERENIKVNLEEE